MEHEDVTRQIIGSAYKVYNVLGYGFLESVYQKAMALEMSNDGLSTEQEKPLKVFYENEVVGDFFADIVVEDKVIVELKSLEKLAKAHEVQLVNYLTATGIDVGLLINFGPKQVEVKRKYRAIEQESRQAQSSMPDR